MIDPAHPYVSWYLWAFSALFAVCFAIPLLVMPLRWAKVFRWHAPAETALTVYFGRCLGAAAVAIVFAAVRTAPQPAAHPLVFEMIIVAGALLTIVHVVGALERSQPWTETAEIALYAAATLVTTLCYRAVTA